MPLAPEDVLEGLHHRGGAGAGRAGDRDDGMSGRHGCRSGVRSARSGRNSERSLNSGELNGWSSPLSYSRVVALDALDLVARAEDHRHALVQRSRHARPGCGRARCDAAPPACSIEHRHRVGLVQQAQPARACSGPWCPRVHEDAAAHQDAVHLGHHRGDPAHVEVARRARPSCRPGTRRRSACTGGSQKRAFDGVDRELAACPRGSRRSGCVRMKLPISRSSVKPCTPLPTVSTSIVDGP